MGSLTLAAQAVPFLLPSCGQMPVFPETLGKPEG